MPTVAAIDVGSNAIRMIIADVGRGGRSKIVENLRVPIRLGQDVFTSGSISDNTTERAARAFEQFRRIIDRHSVARFKASGTSALREAVNRDKFIRRVVEASAIEISVIPPEEEARLIHLAVGEKVNLNQKRAMLFDIGGGSVEMMLLQEGTINSIESFNMGSVRLLYVRENPRQGELRFNQLVSEYGNAIQVWLKREIGNKAIDLCIGTGGNVESLGDLRKELYKKKSNSKITAKEVDQLVEMLQGMTLDERIQQLQLRADRADVIVPASIVLREILRRSGVDEVVIPRVGLKDGLLADIAGTT